MLVNVPGQLLKVNGVLRVCLPGNGAMCHVMQGWVPLPTPRQS